MCRDLAISFIGWLGFTLGACTLQANVIVGAPGNPGVGDCVPFGCALLDPSGTSAVPSEYQQIFDSSLFAGPITISGLTFFLNNVDNVSTGIPNTIYPSSYTVTFSVVSIAVNGLDSTVENNINPATARTFYAGTPADPVTGGSRFTIAGLPFTYDPSRGNLLLDISNTPFDPTNTSLTMFPDINSASGGFFSSAFDSDPHPIGCPDGSAGVTTGCTGLNSGLVLEFETATATPEPATIWLGMACCAAIIVRCRRIRGRLRG